MEQIHKRFTAEQVKALLKGYHQGILDRSVIEEILGIILVPSGESPKRHTAGSWRGRNSLAERAERACS